MMNSLRMLWVIMVTLGLLFVMVFDAGKGIDSPAYWLIPIGVVGGILNTIFVLGFKKTIPLIIVWVLTFFELYGGLYGWLCRDWDCLITMLGAAILSIAGTIMMFLYLGKEGRETRKLS